MTILNAFLKNESGATAIEYSLLAAVISTAIIGIGTTFKTDIGAAFSNIGAKVKSNTL